ncbi:MAG: hypothetical protein VYB08_10665, partial [Candidatus Latescibacterota bacterium]|nr:hypothetical protein [Candidatus Latescibacterota bacterium]
MDSACFAFRDRLADVFDFEIEEGRIAPIGDMTTKDLSAYQHFVKGHDLTYAGYFEEGARELIKATQVDTQFALAYSITACTLSFAKQDSLSAHYFALAQRFAGDRLLTGSSLASLIFQGNSAWGAGDAKTCCDRYRLATELYPDEREDFSLPRVMKAIPGGSAGQGCGRRRRPCCGIGDGCRRIRESRRAVTVFFSIYFDWAY